VPVDCCNSTEADLGGGAQTGARGEALHGLPRAESRWQRPSTIAGAIAVALVPKCPACWSAYAGLSSLLGLQVALDERYLLPLTSALLALAGAALWLQARRGRGYGPWLLACGAAGATLAGKFALENDALMYAGIGSLLLASLWSSCRWGWLRARAQPQPG